MRDIKKSDIFGNRSRDLTAIKEEIDEIGIFTEIESECKIL